MSGNARYFCDLQVLRDRLGFSQPSIDNDYELVFTDVKDEDEDDSEYQVKMQNLKKVLSQCPGGGIHSGTQLQVMDDTQGKETGPHFSFATIAIPLLLFVRRRH